LTKIFLTQVGSDLDDSQVASDDDNNFQGYLMFGFLAFIYIFTIYGLYTWGPLFFILLRPRMVLKLTIL
jgi:cytochrome c oxidase subunit 2